MRFVLIDDNPEIHFFLITLLKSANFLKDVAWEYQSFNSSESFIHNYIQDDLKTIVLLDIELPDMNGIQLAEYLSKTNKQAYVIFLTSYQHYMKDAFGLNVYQYLLKQDINKQFLEIVESLFIHISNHEEIKIPFITNTGNITINESDIVCVLYEDRKTILYTRNKKIIVYRETMTSIYNKLCSTKFIRPNRSALVNIDHIKTIDNPNINLWHYNFNIFISRNRYQEIKNQYKNYFLDGESL